MPKFLQPTSLAQTWEMLTENEDTRFLAGGTDLLVLLRQKVLSCTAVMDVKKLPELVGVRLRDETLEIGAATTCNRILEAAEIGSEYAVLKQAAATLANSLLRNRATLVGNICNASPGGDMLPACLVLGASVVAVSPRGERTIALKDFFVGVKRHVLARDELITHVSFPRVAGRGFYLKKKRIRGHDLAQVGVAGFHAEDGRLRLALGAVATTPLLLDDFGVIPRTELAACRDRIVEVASSAAQPISDIRASREYRLHLVRLFTGQIIDRLMDEGDDGCVERMPAVSIGADSGAFGGFGAPGGFGDLAAPAAPGDPTAPDDPSERAEV
jgi:carbon-monoxide dehydrogenase medium subunit